MIAKEKIEHLLKEKVITISYKFLEIDGEISVLAEEEFVDPTNDNSLAYKAFCKNFKGDRLTVTMGAIAMSHSIKKHKDRKNFSGKNYYFDLRETDNEIQIFPGETLSICSNERIGIKDHYGAYILPRLTLADAGLFYVPSYIDPTWDGLMQAVIHNFSKNKVKLKIGEGVSICRFYKIDGELDDSFKEEFRVKNHHFGQNWEGILDESRDPIRRGKKPTLDTFKFKYVFDAAEVVFQFLKNHYVAIFSGSIILALGWTYQAVHTIVKEYPEIKKSVTQLNKQIERVPDSYKISIEVPEKKLQFIHVEKIKRKQKTIETIWVQALNDKNIESVIVDKKKTDDTHYEIRFLITLKKELVSSKFLTINYMLVD